ncbi:MAG: hypothetical protein M0R21_03250 [Lentimicrobiaceae bacterium]|nr:hypothetical protein [Lentimicrobiaceae bacterium]
MKKNIPLLLLVLLGLNTMIYAAKWRVNNISGVNADFTTAQAVNDSSSVLTGDTVYFEGSLNSYGDLTLSKRLVIIGPGYFLGENDSTQANLLPAILGTVVINPGAENSVITGMTTSTFYVRCNNILLKRDNLGQTNIGDAGAASNIFILQCWIYRVYITTGSQNVIIKNNIFFNAGAWDWNVQNEDGSAALYINNIFQTNCFFHDCEIRNNIFTGPCGTAREGIELNGSCITTNNISACGSLPAGSGNQTSIDMTTVFVYTGSSDGQYRLLPGSPAIGAGYDGVDCGVFGGSNSYVLSGLPTVPAIWKLDIDGTTVILKAKSH